MYTQHFIVKNKYLIITFILNFALQVNAQSAYFHTSKDDIEKVAKKDGYRVSTEMKMVGETMNIIYYLKKDDIIIRVGYVPDMNMPAWINYTEE